MIRFALVLSPIGLTVGGLAQGPTPYFTPGNLVVVVEGCGVNGGTCTAVPNGLGTGVGNSSAGGYGDNQAAPVTLFQYTPTATTSATYVNSLVLPQTGSGANLPIAGEYGSSSEGELQLSGQGQYLTLGTYGINATTFNANPVAYGAAPSNALAQSGSLTGQSYTPVARVVTLIDPFGNVNSSTALFNVFNTNNPRSVYSADGTTAYVSGQGAGSDPTGGVFFIPQLGVVNNAPTPITGLDTSSGTFSQDTRVLTEYNNTLYVSTDTKGGSNNARSFIGTLGAPPATTLFNSGAGPTQLVSSNNASTPTNVSSAGKTLLTASEANTVNAGLITSKATFNMSPSGYFFANPYTLYIADTGNPKQNSASSLYGDGGLQKWINTQPDGSGTWELMYTMSLGLNLVANPSAVPSNTTGSTGLYGLAGVVNGANVYLYATNATIADLDPTYLYGISDSIAATTNPGTSFTLLATAPSDSNFKGVSFAPSVPVGGATINTVPQGLQVMTVGTGCAPGTYVTPVTLVWTPGSNCELVTTTTQTADTAPYFFTRWQDGTTNPTDVVIAPSTAATYTATFSNTYQPVVTVTSGSIVLGTATTTLTAQITFIGPAAPTGISFTVNGSAAGVGTVACTGSTSPVTCTASYATSSLAVGSYPIAAIVAASGSSTSATGTGTLTVTALPDFLFATSGTASQTVTKGGSTSFTFSLSPTLVAYPGAVNFSVSGLPSGTTSTFSPATITTTGGAQTVTLAIQTATSSAANAMRGSLWTGTSLALAGVCLLPLGFRRRLRSGIARNLTLLLFFCCSVAGFVGLVGCSGGSTPPPASSTPVTSTVTVIATSGSLQHTATVTLIVQ